MKKKILAVILTLVMTLAMVSVVAFADDPRYVTGATPNSVSVSVGGVQNVVVEIDEPAVGNNIYSCKQLNTTTFVEVSENTYFSDGQSSVTVPITGLSAGTETLAFKLYKNGADIDSGTVFVNVTVTPPPQYTVTFNTNGGTPAAIESQIVTEGGKVTKPADPTRDGYKFIGWIQGDGSPCWNFETDLVAGDMTLTAVWFELKEFDVELSQKEFTYDGEAHVPEYVVKDQDGNTLTEGIDYHVSIAGGVVSKQIEAGEVEMIFYSDKDGYKNTTVTYKIVDTPKTGDTTNMWLYILVAALALGAMGAGVVVMRRKANR